VARLIGDQETVLVLEPVECVQERSDLADQPEHSVVRGQIAGH
jgi:hypothetical protein